MTGPAIRLGGLLLCGLWLAAIPPLQAGPSDAATLAQHYREARLLRADALQADSPDDLAAAEQLRRAWLRRLAPLLGPRVGYKAALTSAAAQARFGVQQPLLGDLHQGMLYPAPARLPQGLGARLLVEADLLLRWDCQRPPAATDDLALLACLSHLYPFIELPDLLYAPDWQPDAAGLLRINLGARAGVVGTAWPLRADAATLQALADLEVVLDGSAIEPRRGRGRDLLGHPLAVVRWMRKALAERGESLRPGDLLSLGSLTAPQPIRGPGRIQARYHGLAEAPLALDLEILPVAATATRPAPSD